MAKKILIIVLIVGSVFAVNFNINAADAVPGTTRKAGGFDRTRPNKFTASLKNLGRYFLLYIPNRFIDATDIITADLNIGGGFAAEMQATRYLQLGGSYGESYFIAKAYARQYGSGHKDTNHFGFIFMEKDITFVNEAAGSIKEYVIDFPQFSTADYHLDAFRDDDVDFWKLGIRMGWVIELGLGIHPVEIADFITGIFFLDILNDDF
ncbi:MAG: hypothetical protein KAS17_11795 [Victivallaceae bacterium]|nr:hypothetical protein [Victivallaceae bacterium]